MNVRSFTRLKEIVFKMYLSVFLNSVRTFNIVRHDLLRINFAFKKSSKSISKIKEPYVRFLRKLFCYKL